MQVARIQTQPRLTYVRSISCALWVHAHGFPLIRCEMSNDGTGAVIYVFAPEAAPTLSTYIEAKDRLNAASMRARAGQ